MLKTNEQILKEKIEYANKKIANYENRIADLIELVKYNRAIIENLQNRRKHEKVFYDIEKNEARKLKNTADKASEYEENLKQENLDLANQIDIAERHLKSITETRDNLTAILNKTKKTDKTLK